MCVPWEKGAAPAPEWSSHTSTLAGLSDPYCLLGIEARSQEPAHHEHKKRMKAVVKDLIPEDQIHRTQVINQTLSPVWNETFIL